MNTQDFNILNNSVIIRNEDTFRFACQNNHLEVARWLMSIYPSSTIKPNPTLVRIKQKDIAFSSSCSICLGTTPNCKTVCNHEFCYMCLKKWYQKNKTCPCCRSTVAECYVKNTKPKKSCHTEKQACSV
jgi:hypothetical protein